MLRWLLLMAVVLPFGARAAGDGPAERLAALRALVFDSHSTFSVRATLAELDAIEPDTTADGPERGLVMHLRSVIENKGQRAEDSIRHGEEALRIDALHPFLDGHDRMMLHYDVAKQADHIGRCAAAVPHFQAAVPMMAQQGVGKDQQLGTRSELAYCLHEAGRFAEARDANQAVLAEAVALFPPGDPRTFPTRLNLAQNQYSLHDPAAAGRTLEALNADADTAGDADMVDQTLFQLGVLAYEGGRPAEALQRMERRLALARAAGDADRTDAAQGDLDELHRKLSGRTTP